MGNGSTEGDGVHRPEWGAARATAPSSWADSQLAHLERQNRRLAFDIHDGVSQSLCAAMLQAETIDSLAETPEQHEAIGALRSLLDSALSEIHNLVSELRPDAVDAEGLVAMLNGYIEEYTGRTGLAVDFDVSGEEPELSVSARIAVFRIVQESLTNVRKHAGVSRARVALRFETDSVVCHVIDDGDGFSPELTRSELNALGHGILGMTERAHFLDGELDVRSAPGLGTTVTARIPVWR
jgi:two-component system sensor histidine kinase DegS